MKEFLSRLSGASRRSRFHGAVNDVSPSLLRRLVDADGNHHAAWVACVWGPHGEEIVGEAVWSLVAPDERTAELAISVRDDWQGKGVADELMRTLIASARESGLRTLYGDVLQANTRMLAFMRRHGMHPGICEAPPEPGAVRVGCLFEAPGGQHGSRRAPRRSWRDRLSSLWFRILVRSPALGS
jgi:RimJ/RimL family protein N-acetyltransferase